VIPTRTKKITYRVSTALLGFILLSGGAAQLAHPADGAAALAAASQLASGSAAIHVIVPIVLTVVALVSWATRLARRTLKATP
jgi:hypothetical protein